MDQRGIGLAHLIPGLTYYRLRPGSLIKLGTIARRGRASFQVQRSHMPPVSIFLNILWVLLGGAWMAAGWVVAAIIMAITIVGIPWARAAFNIAVYTLFPFGQRAVSRADYLGREDTGTGPLGMLGNIVWLVLAGWVLALRPL